MNQSEYDRGYSLGQVVALEQLGGRLAREAGDQFALGQKKAAEITWEFSERIKAEGKEARKQHLDKFKRP